MTHGKEPLIAREHAAVAAAVATAVGGLLAYFIAAGVALDGRLDRLEESVHVLIDAQGAIRPSKEAMQTFFHVKDLDRRVDRLEGIHDSASGPDDSR